MAPFEIDNLDDVKKESEQIHKNVKIENLNQAEEDKKVESGIEVEEERIHDDGSLIDTDVEKDYNQNQEVYGEDSNSKDEKEYYKSSVDKPDEEENLDDIINGINSDSSGNKKNKTEFESYEEVW
jgi:hypothetical protein